MWFERQFTFKLGPHLLRGRVDRVDRLPGGEYELIDYKTGRPKTRDAARRGRAALALRGGRARGLELEAARGRPTTTCSTTRRSPSRRRGRPREWIARGGDRGRRGDPLAGVRADAVVRGVLDLRLPAGVPGGRALTRRGRAFGVAWRRTSPDGLERDREFHGSPRSRPSRASCDRSTPRQWPATASSRGARRLALGSAVLDAAVREAAAGHRAPPAHGGMASRPRALRARRDETYCHPRAAAGAAHGRTAPVRSGPGRPGRAGPGGLPHRPAPHAWMIALRLAGPRR